MLFDVQMRNNILKKQNNIVPGQKTKSTIQFPQSPGNLNAKNK